MRKTSILIQWHQSDATYLVYKLSKGLLCLPMLCLKMTSQLIIGSFLNSSFICILFRRKESRQRCTDFEKNSDLYIFEGKTFVLHRDVIDSQVKFFHSSLSSSVSFLLSCLGCHTQVRGLQPDAFFLWCAKMCRCSFMTFYAFISAP